jgi:hypothetical protein
MSRGAISIRIPEDSLAEIDRRAQSRTAYLISAGLADHNAQTLEEERLDSLERSVGRLEATTFGTAE